MHEFSNLSIIQTDDGSSTLYNARLDETYHSRRGAQTESECIYIGHGLAAVRPEPDQVIRVLEIGFGTGLNALLTWDHALKNGLSLHYDTYEAYPLSPDVIASLRFPVTDQNPEYRSVLHRFHHEGRSGVVLNNEHSQMEFRLLCQKIQEAELTEKHYDVVYFDAFAPSKQKDIWEKDILESVFRSIKRGGRLVTYCAQGNFKRNLKSIGFNVSHPPGPMGKKEMTVAVVP